MTAPYSPPPDQQALFQTFLGLVGNRQPKAQPTPTILDAIHAYVEQIGQAAKKASAEGVPARRDVIPAGYLDTLKQLAGAPSGTITTPAWLNNMIHDALGGSGTAGNYLPAVDLVTVNKDYATDRTVVAHEFGHHFDHTHPTSTGARAANQTQNAPAMFDGKRNYASANRQEQFAVAFENAQKLIDYASEIARISTGRPPGDAAFATAARRHFERNLKDGEEMAPGTTALLSMMLRHPIYADHPVQSFRTLIPAPPAETPPAAQADATRVKKP